MRIRILILFLFVYGLIHAQKLPFDNYTIKDGLPSNVILDVIQDQKGYMWFATQVGLVRFDGYSFQTYTVDDGLPDNYIHSLYIDSEGNLWAGSESGFAIKFNGFDFLYYSNNHFRQSKIIEFIEDDEGNILCLTNECITKISAQEKISVFSSKKYFDNNSLFTAFLTKNGQIWLGTGNGIYILNKDNSIEYLSDEMNDVAVTKIIQVGDQSYWICTQGLGLVSMNNKKLTVYSKKSQINTDIILDIYQTRNKNIWISTYDQGVYYIQNDSIKSIFSDYTKKYIIRNIKEDNQGRIWMQTHKNGIILIKRGELFHYTSDNNLLENSISKDYIDKDGNLWITTYSGISKYGKMLFEIYDIDFGLPDNKVTSVHETSDGNIFIGTYDGLSVLKDNTIQNYKRDTEGNSLLIVLSIQEDNKHNCWIGTYTNIYKREGYELVSWPFFLYNIYDVSDFFDLTVDKKGDILCAADNKLLRFNENKAEVIISREQLPDIEMNTVTVDKENNYWIGTKQGIIFYNSKDHTSEILDTKDGLAHSTIYDITCDTINSRILTGTDGGISVITRKSNHKFDIRNITIEDGLKSNIIYLVTTDKEGNIWVGHDKGLNRINSKTSEISYYGDLDGFYPMETYSRAVQVMQNGNILFGTGEGLVKFVTENEIKSTNPPNVYITDVKLFNDSTSLSNFYTEIDSSSGLPANLVLPYDKNDLVFKYVGIHFTNVKKNKFVYMLDGYDNDWSEPVSDIETPPYRKIRPGTYTFKVKASNCDGVWTENPVEFTFTIKPPFWQTTWFYALMFIVAIGIFYLIVVLRVRKLKHDKRILEEKVQERTIQIRKQRDQIASQNREIKDSIHYAKRIQTAVLPNEEIINKLLPEYFILFKPRDIVSGDFYWINGINNKIIVIAADCTGHGVPGAFMSMLGVSILNDIIQPGKKVSASKILNELREQIKITLSQTGKVDETKDGMDLAMSIIDFDNMKLQFAGAYNPLIYISKGELNVYKGDKMPIGIHVGNETGFSEHEITVQKGDCIYMFSDGYADQFGGPEEKKYMSGRFKQLLLEIHTKSMKEQKEMLDNTIEEWKGELQQVDDILVVGVRI